jgi:fatty acid desaturase
MAITGSTSRSKGTGEYVQELKPHLPVEAFEPARSRLWWLPLHLSVIALGTVLIALKTLPIWALPVASLVIGASFAGLVFLGHETLHGGVVRGKRLRYLVGFVTFLPFVVSPRLWMAWHNRVHHGNANRAGVDPDAYPTLAEHQSDLGVRIATDWFGIGRGRLHGLVSLFIGFAVQSAHVLVFAGRRGYLKPREHRLAVLETALGATLWLGLAWALGPIGFFFACFVPWLVANTAVMAFILTNHSLSPLTDKNDPLENSLTVTVPRWVDVWTLNFGAHVEHHLFPWMSSRHAPAVTRLVRERWPDRYQSLPLLTALGAVHRTARVYLNPTTLVDPRTGECFPTLGAERTPPRPGNDTRGSINPHAA